MPKIPTYDTNVSPESQLPGSNPYRVDADPSSFGAGRGLSTLAAGLEDAGETLYRAEEQQEVSDLRTRMAQLRGNLTAGFQLKASKTAPGDPTFTDSFMGDVTNQLAQMGGELQTKAGRRAFQMESADLTSTFLAKATDFTIAGAGAKAVADWNATVNENAGTLFNDPSQAGSIFKSIDTAMDDPNGPFAMVPPEKKAALEQHAKEQLAIAAARGVVRDNPGLAETLYNKSQLPGQKYLTEAGNAQIVSYIQTAQNAERTKKALALAQQEHAMTMAAESDGNAILRDIVKDPSNPGITDKILNSRMKWSQKQTMLNIAEHTGTGSGESNSFGKGFYDVYQKIHSGEITSPDQLYKRVGANGDLTVAGVDRLTNEIMGKRTPDGQIEADLKSGFIKTMSQAISGTNDMLGMKDPRGDQLRQQALAWFLPAYQKAKEEGKYPPSVLLDPASPHSLWQGAMRFKRPVNEQMRDMMNFAGAINAPSAGIGGAAKAAAAEPAGPTRITNDAEYAKLPKGAQYVAPDGKVRTKK